MKPRFIVAALLVFCCASEAEEEERGSVSVAYSNGKNQTVGDVVSAEVQMEVGLYRIRVERSIASVKREGGVFVLEFDPGKKRAALRGKLLGFAVRYSAKEKGEPEALDLLKAGVESATFSGMQWNESDEHTDTHEFTLADHTALKFSPELSDMGLWTDSGKAVAVLPLEYVRRMDFQGGRITALAGNDTKLVVPASCLRFSWGEPAWGFHGFDANADWVTVEMNNILAVESGDVAPPDPVAEGEPVAVATDTGGTVYRIFDLKPQLLPVYGEYGFCVKTDMFDQYLWLHTVKSIERLNDSSFRFTLTEGDPVVGEWRRGVPDLYHGDRRIMLSWSGILEHTARDFFLEARFLRKVDLHWPEYANKSDMSQWIEGLRAASVTTTKGRVKADHCFISLAAGEWSGYCCYPQIDDMLKYFPENYAAASNKDKDMDGLLVSLSVKEISSLKIFKNEPAASNPRGFYPIEFTKKNGKATKCFLASPGESRGGKWVYWNRFDNCHVLVCFQGSRGAMAIPLSEVSEIVFQNME